MVPCGGLGGPLMSILSLRRRRFCFIESISPVESRLKCNLCAEFPRFAALKVRTIEKKAASSPAQNEALLNISAVCQTYSITLQRDTASTLRFRRGRDSQQNLALVWSKKSRETRRQRDCVRLESASQRIGI